MAHSTRFSTEEKCRDFLIQSRWNGVPSCPTCGNTNYNYYLSTRKIFKCYACHKQFSVTQGTIFHKSKIPLTTWFQAIYFFTTIKRGVSSVQMGKLLDIKQPTAWFMLQRLREALKDENNIVLTGIVEADETFKFPKVSRDTRLMAKKMLHEEEQDRVHGFNRKKRLKLGIKEKRGRKKGSTKEVLKQKELERGGRKYSSIRPSNRIPFEQGIVVLGMAEQKGKVVMKNLGSDSRSVNQTNIFPHLQNHITQNSTFLTDQLNIYDATSELFAEHLTVNHNIGYVINGVHINNIENAWKHLKKMIEHTYFHLSYRYFDRYLNENTYRWNRREESVKNQFESFMPLVTGKRITYKELKVRHLKLAA